MDLKLREEVIRLAVEVERTFKLYDEASNAIEEVVTTTDWYNNPELCHELLTILPTSASFLRTEIRTRLIQLNL